MERLIISSTTETPYIPNVDFNTETGICEISGDSYMEDTYKFYKPLIQWLVDYYREKKKPITLNVKLLYFNTSTSRCILEILECLKEFNRQGLDVNVNWYYDTNDPDMKNDIEDFEIESKMIINSIEL